jgi:hypothetical protein
MLASCPEGVLYAATVVTGLYRESVEEAGRVFVLVPFKLLKLVSVLAVVVVI